MTIEQFTAKWFTFYYFSLGLLLACGGITLLIKVKTCTKYLSSEIETDNPPSFLRSVLKYFLIFTIPGFIFSFIPFLWFEFLFSLWSFIIIFVIGSQLVHWPQTRGLLKHYFVQISRFIRWTGVAMIMLGLVAGFLGYQEIQRLFPGK